MLSNLEIGGADAIALAKPLPAISGKAGAVLVLRYPIAKALAGFRPLQIGILLTGFAGLIVVVFGSLRLAGTIARPIAELDRAARALKEGSRAEVSLGGNDEIGRLATSFNAMARGIFEREDQIAHMAFNDALTGLPNRMFFREQLDSRLRVSARGKAEFAILCLDLDGFTAINDTLGQPFGDKVLRAFSAILNEAAPDAFVARLGGDGFGLILPNDTNGEGARALAQAILDRLRLPLIVEDQPVPIGASIGIALAPGDGNTAELVMKAGDLALHRAKKDGRNGFRFFEPALDAAARTRRQMELDLRDALEAGQLRLDFQPIFAGESGGIVSFEALLRWDHPTLGPVPPQSFIPVAEESGLILRIGDWVVQEACRQARLWPEQIRVAVNVSPLQFRNPGFSATVLQALARSGVAPSRLELEITESMFFESADDTLTMLQSLRSLGIRIALDDFGTGFSSLSYLRRFPFDKIKIDKSFVDDLGTDASAAAITQAVLDLARALGADSTAEGVETQAQLEILRAQGCRTIQGYLLGRPISAAAAAALCGEAEDRQSRAA